jgi:polyvinyl alcohol dehydrogenase (cytochrome)
MKNCNGSGYSKSMLICLMVMCSAGSVSVASAASSNATDWPTYNGDALGTRSNSSDSAPTPAQLSQKGLEIKWKFPADGSSMVVGTFTGTPAVVNGVVYAGDTNGNFFALDANGNLLWSQSGLGQITDSALVTDKRVIIGTNTSLTVGGSSGGEIIGFYRNAENGHAAGDIAYRITMDKVNRTNPFISYTGSAMLAKGAYKGNDLALMGLSSYEEYATINPSYPCCSFRGGLAAFDPNTGEVRWVADTISVDDLAAGSSGAPVWSTPTYDAATKMIYISTGNNYSAPATITSDAIIALNAKDGTRAWVTQLYPNDTWNFRFPMDEQTPDADFGDSVNIFSLADGTRVVAAGQKSGFVHLLNASTGLLLDQYQLAPFGNFGGVFADSAFANGKLFANGTTQYCSETDLTCSDSVHHGVPKSGFISGLNMSTSHITEAWRFESQAYATSGPGTTMMTGVAHAKNVVYAVQTDIALQGRDKLFALDAQTGQKITELSLPTLTVSGPSISGNRLYLGTGLSVFGVLQGQIISIGVKQ